jgi:hypothetical protein
LSRFLHYEPCERCRERGKDSHGDNLAAYGDGGKHCFSCGMHIHPPSSSRWAPKVHIELEAKAKRILPDDFTKDVPARCWEWLLQWGLPYSYWEPLVGYSEKYKRLVFRVGEPLVFSIGRYLPSPRLDEEPTPKVRKWNVWGDAHKHVERFGEESRSIILVEDLISAHKVGQVNECIPLFGTQIFPALLYYLRQKDNIILWLDEDQLDTMPKKCSNLELLTGVKCEYRSTAKDPKEVSLRDINRIISDGN